MYVPREIEKRFDAVSAEYSIVALVGPRQAGKTTFLRHKMQDSASYMMFDDPDVVGLFNEDIKRFEAQYLAGNNVSALDEVQYGKDAGPKLKYLADRGHKLWITSSSETVLSSEVLSFLVGRVSVMRIYPFSLPEFLDAKGQKEMAAKALQRNVWDHMIYGGYPKAALAESYDMKQTILKDLYETMVLKDVARYFSVREVSSLERLTKYLAYSIGNQMVYHSVSGEIGISFQTLRKYIDAMEKSYLIRAVPPFHTNRTKEITKQPRLYFIDTGLRNAIAGFAPNPEETGKIFENYIFSELVKSGFEPRYWQTKAGAEVDFVVESNGAVVPVEAKMGTDGNVGRGLRAFIEEYGPKKAIVASYSGHKSETEIGGCKVVFTDVLGMRKELSDPVI